MPERRRRKITKITPNNNNKFMGLEIYEEKSSIIVVFGISFYISSFCKTPR
jgi:hypothetical protein